MKNQPDKEITIGNGFKLFRLKPALHKCKTGGDKSPEEAMPLMEDHLKRCGECREEYEVLLEALKNVQP